MMAGASYLATRERLETYFDRTAHAAWAALTSDAPVSGVRATVRAGRDAMRATLLSWLPANLVGARVLDAGSGAGQLAIDAAARGAQVLGIDVSANLVALAAERAAGAPGADRVRFIAGDMLSPPDGPFDHVVAMDSLIHYAAPDMVEALAALARHAKRSVVFTFAPRTPALAAMHAIGGFFPKADRAPAIEPIAPMALARAIATAPGLSGWRIGRTQRIARGFYTSQALELVLK